MYLEQVWIQSDTMYPAQEPSLDTMDTNLTSTPPSQDVCSRDGGIRLLPSGSDRSTAVCNHDGWRNDLRRFHRYPYDMRILRGRDQTKWQGQKSTNPRPRIPRHTHAIHAHDARFQYVHMLPPRHVATRTLIWRLLLPHRTSSLSGEREGTSRLIYVVAPARPVTWRLSPQAEAQRSKSVFGRVYWSVSPSLWTPAAFQVAQG